MFASLLSFFFYSHGDHRDLHSFPTRRSSDLYHMQIMQGDLVEGLRSNLDIVGHVQVSSLPGRHEPQYGEVNFAYVFDEVDAMGYDGWIGCEYRPRNDTREGLTWALPYGIVPRS